AKLQEERVVVSDELVARLVRHLIEREAWDDAFALVDRFSSVPLFLALLRKGFSAILSESRLSTLTRWVEFAAASELDEPIVDLAEAEVAFREGEKPKAERLSMRAAQRLDATDQLASHASALAGQAAYLAERTELALEYHTKALSLAKFDRDRREALRGQLLAATKLELDDAEAII